MNALRTLTLAAAGAVALTAGSAAAQTQPSREDEVIGAILGAVFGDRFGGGSTLDAQWAAGRRPLYDQRVQFDARVDADVRAGRLSSTAGARLKADYAALVATETRHASDRRFTTQERAELTAGYTGLTRVLEQGGYGEDDYRGDTLVQGRAEFERRVDAQVRARRLSRTDATRLKSDYAALARVEAEYLADGRLSMRERDDLDARLDALDLRVGDGLGGGTVTLTARQRLDAVDAAVATAGLGRPAQTQLRVEIEDIRRLEAAYAQLRVSADDQAYLERRIVDLETRVRIRR